MVVRRLVLFLRTFHNDYQDLLRADCLAGANRHAFQLQVFSADDDAEQQVLQIREALELARQVRPTAFMVSPVRESALLSIAHEVTRAGIGWIVLNRWNDNLLELRGEFPNLPIFAVNPDQNEVGRVQGRQFRALLPQGGELLYIQGPLGTSSSHRRYAGMRDEIAGASIEVVTFNSDWSMEGGASATKEWLRIFAGAPLPLYVVGAQNDEMAMGARKALTEMGDPTRRVPNAIRVTGCDGSPSYGRRLVDAGELAATVVIPPVSGRAVDEVASVLATRRSPPAEIVIGVSSHPDLALIAQRAAKSDRPVR
jgi:ABC-type sugar transport system substrate-binding protein